MTASGKIGHRETWKGKEIKYLYGTGCVHHNNCLTCPLTDCFQDYKILPKQAFKEKI